MLHLLPICPCGEEIGVIAHQGHLYCLSCADDAIGIPPQDEPPSAYGRARDRDEEDRCRAES